MKDFELQILFYYNGDWKFATEQFSLGICYSLPKGEQQVKSNFQAKFIFAIYVIIAGIAVTIWKITNLNHSDTVL